MSFRVSPRFKALLEVAAARENRSLTNMVETLVFAHCDKHQVAELTFGAVKKPIRESKE